MARMSRDNMLMACAFAVSQRSTCDRLHVGVVIARDARILSTGYNGTPAGLPHCDHTCDCTNPGLPLQMEHLTSCASLNPCADAVHAEINAIAYAARNGTAVDGSQMYSTHMPCLPCAQLIINAGIMSVTYHTTFRDVRGETLLHDAGVKVSRTR